MTWENVAGKILLYSQYSSTSTNRFHIYSKDFIFIKEDIKHLTLMQFANTWIKNSKTASNNSITLSHLASPLIFFSPEAHPLETKKTVPNCPLLS